MHNGITGEQKVASASAMPSRHGIQGLARGCLVGSQGALRFSSFPELMISLSNQQNFGGTGI